MGNRKAKRLIAFVMSAILMCSMLLTNGVVARASGQQQEQGTVRFNCQSNAVEGGNVLYKLDGDTEFQVVDTSDGYADIDVSGSQTITLSLSPNEGFFFDEQRGVMIRVDGAMEYNANGDAAMSFVATPENADGVTIDLGALIHNPDKSIATSAFEVEFGFGKPNEGQQGENNPQRPEINQGDVLFCIQNAQNGENSKVYVSATGEDGSWVEVNNYDVIPADDMEGLEAFWVKYELVEGQRLDDYVDNGMSVNRYRVDDEEQALVFNKDNIAEVPYSADKRLEVSIRFMNNNNDAGPSANPGDVVVRINNGQSGRVYLSKNGVDGWENVGNKQVVAKSFFEGADKIYVRYELNDGQRLDDFIDQNSGISVNCYRIDGVVEALDFGDSDIAEVPYSADKNIEINVSFMGGGDNPPGPDIHVEPGDVLFKVRNISNGDVFVSTTKPEDINEWIRLTDEDSVVTADFFEGVSEFYVRYLEHQNQELDDYVDEQTGIGANCYRVDGVATNLEFVEKIATIPYDSEHAIEVELGFKGNGGGPGAGASKDYEYDGEATSTIMLNCNYDVDGAGKVSTPMFYINGTPAFDMLYDAEMNQEVVMHLDVVTYPYDAEDENTPVVDEQKAVEFEFVNAINQRYTDIWINGVDYSGMVPGVNPENRTWEILDAMSLNGQSQDMSFILQVPYAEEYVIDAHVAIIGEDNQFFGPLGAPLAFSIRNASNGTVGYAYGDPAQPGESRTFDYEDLNARFGDDFDWEIERTPEEWEALELSFFPESIEFGKELVLYARPTEGHEIDHVQVHVNGEDFTYLIDREVLIEDGFWIFDTTDFGTPIEVVEFEIEFSKTEAEELEDASYFPVGNFLWSNLEIDRETDMFLDNTIVEFVKFTYKDREGKTIVIDNFEDMNTESYLSFSENPNKGEATLIGGGEITVHLIPRYGYQVVEFGPNGMPCSPDSDEIATYTFTVRNGNAHIGAICAPVEDTVATDAEGISEGSIVLDVEGDSSFEVGTAVLEVTDAETSSEEQTAFEQAADGYDIDSYLDLSLNNVVYKGTADDVWATEVTELANPATISLTVDDEITSDVAIIHQKHDGTYEVLEATYDAETKTITFETDSFSKYAIATEATAPKLEKVEAKAPTCTEDGNIEYYVDSEGVCYEDAEGKTVITDVVIPAAHTEETIEAVTPTCTKTGLTEGKKCSVCGEITVAQTEVEKVAHTEETIEAVASTCTKTGLTEGKKCSVCGEILVEQEVTEKLAHTEVVDEGKEATETEPGLTEGKHCSVCGEIIVAQEEIPVIVIKNGWVQNEDESWGYYQDGEPATDWNKIGGKWYYMNEEGIMQTDWQKISGKWYYFGTNGVMVNGWKKISGKWYYFDGGVMANGWKKISNVWYYFDGGVMVTGWKKISSKWYYFDGGAMVTGWKKISNVWYYFDGGVMATGWKKISNVWYYFDGGAMVTGWKQLSGVWYYFKDGAMVTGKQTIGGKSYTFDSNGALK